MKYLFLLGHPAHFHLYKNSIISLKSKGHEVFILNKKKDVLDDLLEKSGLSYYNILPEGRKSSSLGIIYSLIKRDLRLLRFCRTKHINLLIGSAVEITHIGILLNIPSICVSEDDYDIVPQFSKLGYPFATAILAPAVCKTGKWIEKTITYEGYHELAYLHPENFVPDKNVVRKYFNPEETYFILRFSKLNAYHDTGIQGITDNFATGLIELLKPNGRIFITSEREFTKELNQYKINIDPFDMHHVMAFAKLYIGDSQTMAAESGVLGIPFIRINDFVGRIGYLNELERDFKLGFGFKPDQINAVYSKISELLIQSDLEGVWKEKRQRMLNSKINVEKFMTWLFENFPESLSKTSYKGKKIDTKVRF